MSFLENKQALEALQNEIRREMQAGHALVQNRAATLDEVTAQSEKIDLLQAKEALLKQQMAAEEGESQRRAEDSAKKKPQSAFANFGEFVHAVKDAAEGNRDKRLEMRNAATGANEGVDAEGGYLVPPEYAEGVIDMVETESVLYPQARKVQIAGNRLIEMYLNETDRKDAPSGSRHGGILAYWKGEAAQYDVTKAQFGTRQTDVHKLTALCPVTEELLEDYPAMEGVLTNLCGKEFAFKVDDAILNGTGNGAPLGILATSNTAAQNNAALVTIAKESGQAADTVVIENILKMWNALPAKSRGNAKWYINQDLELILMQLLMTTGTIASTGASAVEGIVGKVGTPIYTPPGAYGNKEAMLLNIPVCPIEHCAALGDKGDIVLMDASKYLIVERGGITKQSSIHVRFDYDETQFKFSWRLGGRPDVMSALTAYKGNSARSPYVCLANR